MKKGILIGLAFMLALNGCNNSNNNHYQGYVEGENIYLASPYSGHLLEVFVERGQVVKKGELLFKLAPNPQQLVVTESASAVKQSEQIYNDLKMPKRPAELAAIEAQIGQASAQLALAGFRVKRNQALYDKHVLDKDSLDAAVERYNELKNLKAQFEANLALAKQGGREDQIKAQLSQTSVFNARLNKAKWELEQKSIYAPTVGVIFDIYFKQGEFVDARKPIAALLAPENIQIEFFVPDVAFSALHVGKQIVFECAGCAKSNQAVIQYISPEAEYVPPLVYSRENRDKLVFRVKATLAHPAQFKPGQPVVVMVPADE